MASSNSSKIVVSSLDFDSTKQLLINYLQSQNVFQDYNFTGSALNQLLNVLAYNTTLLSFYLNMAVNESFFDTAVLFPNIVSRAKLMGYVPGSNTASQAIVNVAITRALSDNTTALRMPAFTTFSSVPLNGVSYNFVSVDDLTVANTGNMFLFNNVIIKEGQSVSKTFAVNGATNPTQMFDLGDTGVDTSTLQVIVQTSNTNISQNTFLLADDATEVTGNTNVYYLDMGPSGTWRIYFGDGILGSRLNDGNLVIVSYLNTSGDAPNGVGTFQLQTTLLSGSVSNTTTVLAASGGTPAETGDEVKFSAPKSYLSQNRCVTVNDYINLINKKYPYFKAVTVWGGEDNNPPVYGKVFISAIPLNGFAVTDAQKQFVVNQVLAPISVLTVIAEFVDPNENFLNFDLTVFYDKTKTSFTATQLQSSVANAVATWANNNLNQFNNTFYGDALLTAARNADSSLTGAEAVLYLQKRFNPTLNTATSYILSTNIPLAIGSSLAKLYSAPQFVQLDASGNPQNCWIEEVPQSSSGIQAIDITNAGQGYQFAPTLTIVGDGTGANAYAVIVNGRIQSVIVDQSGSDFTSAAVTISGGGGNGAVLTPLIEGTIGTLRSFYYANNIKTVMISNVGTINYQQGMITLTNFAPINVANPSNTLSIFAPPLNTIFSSNANTILTWDETDPAALTVTVNVDLTG
jgi:hypothetical protein